MATFGERFRQLRKEKKLTQEKLAEIFYTRKSSISKYENNVQTPEISTLQKYADFFGCTVDYLLGRNDIRDVKNGIIKESSSPYKTELEHIKGSYSPEQLEILKEIETNPALGDLLKDLMSASEEEIKKLIDLWNIVRVEPKK